MHTPLKQDTEGREYARPVIMTFFSLSFSITVVFRVRRYFSERIVKRPVGMISRSACCLRSLVIDYTMIMKEINPGTMFPSSKLKDFAGKQLFLKSGAAVQTSNIKSPF